jgi:tetratricopeptide (TPR) repeat protein
MMRKAWLVIAFLSLQLALPAAPANLEALAQSAAQAYNSGDYRLAADSYEQIIAAGYESSELYFNLGNAYFKLNQIPGAVLFYEKAAKLDPGDEAIRFNLDLANSRVIDKIEPLPVFFLKSAYQSFLKSMSPDGWARLAILSMVLTLAAAFIFLIARTPRTRRLAFWPGTLVLAIFALSLFFSIQSYRMYKKQDTAIIFTPTVTVKSSPSDSSVDLFVIHEGTKVRITDRIDDWSEIRLANGNVGWIKTTTFRPI